MGRPLKILSAPPSPNPSGTTISFKEMTDSEIYNTFIYPILNEYANQLGPANIVANPVGSWSFGSIGLIPDFYTINEVGAHPVYSVDTFQFDQAFYIYNTASESFPRPLTYTNGAIREMTDSELHQWIIDPAISYITNGGLGSYYMNSSTSSAPTHISNATWTLRWSSGDQLTSGSYSSTNQAAIWQVTGLPSPGAGVYPLKQTSPHIIEYTGAQITGLTARLRNKMLGTGVGLLNISPVAPQSGGTWASVGSYTDTRRGDAVLSYAGTYSGSYTGSYAGDYAGSYILYYGASAGPSYTGYYTGYYSGSYTGYYTGYYDGRTIVSSIVTTGPAYYLWVRRS
jgi:hypothetical protein